MSSVPTLFVPADIQKKASTLINCTNGDSTRQGIELLLRSDVSKQYPDGKNPPGVVDAGNLLHIGLSALAQSPHLALGVPIGSSTMDVRKAFKKMALKYHPDKNPQTTPLFLAMKTAAEKLENREEREKVEQKAASKGKPPAPPPQPQAQAPGGQRGANAAYSNPGSQGPSRESGNRNTSQPSQQQKQNQQQASSTYEARQREAEKKAREYAENVMRRNYERKAAMERAEKEDKKNREEALKEQERLREIARNMQREQERAAIAAKLKIPAKTAQPTPFPGQGAGQGQGKEEYIRASAAPATATQAPNLKAFEAGNRAVNGPAGAVAAAAGGGPKGPDARGFYNASNYNVSPAPKPLSLRCTSLGTNVVELQWQLPNTALQASAQAAYSYELGWRNSSALNMWESSKKLIAGTMCRKKNLDVGGSYDFRVRSVEELPGGMLGNRSAWSDILRVYLKQPSFSPQRNFNFSAVDAAARATRASYQKMPTAQQSKEREKDSNSLSSRNAAAPGGGRPPAPTYTATQTKHATTEDEDEEEIKSAPDSMADSDDDDEEEDEIVEEYTDADIPSNSYKQQGARSDQPVRQPIQQQQQQHKSRVGVHSGVGTGPNSRGSNGLRSGSKESDAPPATGDKLGSNFSVPTTLKNPGGQTGVGGFSVGGQKISPSPRHQKYASPTRRNASLVSPMNKNAWKKDEGGGRRFFPEKAGDNSDGSSILQNNRRGRSGNGDGGVGTNHKKAEWDTGGYEDDFETDGDSYVSSMPSFLPRLSSERLLKKNKSSGGGLTKAASTHNNKSGNKIGGALVEVWEVRYDPNGNAFYFNSSSGESKWEPPEWIEETDAASGANYYVQLDPTTAESLHSTWTQPEKFSRLLWDTGK